MAKAPLKQLSVNTFETNRIISPKSSTKKVKDSTNWSHIRMSLLSGDNGGCVRV
jgi:hypothetical protein